MGMKPLTVDQGGLIDGYLDAARRTSAGFVEGTEAIFGECSDGVIRYFGTGLAGHLLAPPAMAACVGARFVNGMREGIYSLPDRFHEMWNNLFSGDPKKLGSTLFQATQLPAEVLTYASGINGMLNGRVSVPSFDDTGPAQGMLLAAVDQNGNTFTYRSSGISAGAVSVDTGPMLMASSPNGFGATKDSTVQAATERLGFIDRLRIWFDRKKAERLVEEGNYGDAAPVFERIGDYSKAADAFLKIGQEAKAAEMYMKAGLPGEAAPIFERMGDYSKAANALLEFGQEAKAAEMYMKAGLPGEAAPIFERMGDYSKAAIAFIKNGQGAKAAEMYMRAERYNEAGQLFEGRRMFPEAIEAYKKAGNMAEAEMVRTLYRGVEPRLTENLVANVSRPSDLLGRFGSKYHNYKYMVVERDGSPQLRINLSHNAEHQHMIIVEDGERVVGAGKIEYFPDKNEVVIDGSSQGFPTRTYTEMTLVVRFREIRIANKSGLGRVRHILCELFGERVEVKIDKSFR